MPRRTLFSQVRSIPLVFSIAAALAAGGFSTAHAQAIARITADQAIERDLAAGKKDAYSVSLDEKTYAVLRLTQNGIDVTARVFNGDNKLIFEFDTEPRINGVETIEIVADQPQVFRLDIEPRYKDAAAGKYELRYIESRPATPRDADLNTARILATKSRELDRAGQNREAIAVAENALRLRAEHLGGEHPLVAAMLNRIGIQYYLLGDNSRSEEYIKRALAILEKQPVRDELAMAEPRNNLAVLARLRGDYIDAEKLFLSVVEARESILGSGHPAVASNLLNLAVLYRNRGDYDRAEALYRRVIDIRERAAGKDSLELATPLNNLASLFYYRGDYASASEFDRRVIAIREAHMPPGHPEIALAYANAGATLTDLQNYAEAESFFHRALELFRKKSTPEPAMYTSALFNFANLLRNQRKYDAARPLYIEAIAGADALSKQEPQRRAMYGRGYASMLTSEGKFAEAEAELKRSLEIFERVLGPDHTDVGAVADMLARLYILQGNSKKAIEWQTRANAINEAGLVRNLTTGTEHQKLAYAALMTDGMNQTVALHVQKAPQSPDALKLALNTVLQRKSRVLDSMTSMLASLRARSDSETRNLLERVADVNARVAELSLTGPKNGDLAGFQTQLAQLEAKKRTLEAEVGRRSAGFYRPAESVTVERLAAAIPANAALVEFVVYQPVTASARDDAGARYAVYALKQGGRTGWADIGDVKSIDVALEKLKSSLRDRRSVDHTALARGVYDKLIRPIASFIGDAEHLLIAPDGALNLIPFEALAADDGRYLVQSHAISYLSAGRDLLRVNSGSARATAPLLVADPRFGGAADRGVAASYAARGTRGISDAYFSPLTGSGAEARAIRALFPQARYITGSSATETAVKNSRAPEILHIATHGFFLQKPLRGASGRTPAANPLLRSGLALAGANDNGDGLDDGILTAMEASGLDLWGTKLVVLSACDTGLGEVHNGEGVYGLRRSFAVAGAETIVMSLWPVSDQVTRESMVAYYRNLKQGAGRGEALRRVQLGMIKDPARRHPFYWASFIQSGEWRSLDDVR